MPIFSLVSVEMELAGQKLFLLALGQLGRFLSLGFVPAIVVMVYDDTVDDELATEPTHKGRLGVSRS